MSKIGVGLVTYNAPEKIIQSAFSIPSSVDEVVIVNDGSPYDNSCYPSYAHIIQHQTNLKVSKTKNDGLHYLFEKGCEHIFLMEDDVIIKDPAVFQTYIKASEVSGIFHLNFALQGPHNFKKKFIKDKMPNGDLSDRIFNEEDAEPSPLYTLEYEKGAMLSFYPGCVGAFSYFRRVVIEEVGYFDEKFQNAWEHVEHTYRIIQKGYHPPFWWFADISDSNNYLSNIENCMENSTIAKDPQWKKNSEIGEQYFKSLHGYIPGRLPKTKENTFKKSLIQIYNLRGKGSITPETNSTLFKREKKTKINVSYKSGFIEKIKNFFKK